MRICIVGEPGSWPEQLESSLVDAGLDLTWCSGSRASLAGLSCGPAPGVVVIDATAGLPGTIPGRGAVVIAVCVDDDMTTRLAALRAGIDHVLPAPVDPGRLCRLLDEIGGRHPSTPTQVMLVDSDNLRRRQLATVLTGAGMGVREIADPLQVFAALRESPGDVVVSDSDPDGCSGNELARLIRGSRDIAMLPLVFLADEPVPADRMRLLDAGADDLLSRSMPSAALVSTIRARARRSRSIADLMATLQDTLYEREREHLAIDHHAIVSIADRAGDIIYVNDRFCEISGYPRSEILGRNHRVLKSGLHPPSFYEDMWGTIRTGQVWQGEICNRRKDGQHYWVESTITPFLDDNGDPYQYVSIRTDITHVKQAEADLRWQRDMQLMITEVAAGFLGVSDADMDVAIDHALRASGRFIEADRAYLFMLSEDGTVMTNTHEWCADGIDPQIANSQALSLADYPWWCEQIGEEGIIIVSDVTQLPAEAAAERALFEAQSVRSLFVIPLQKDARTFGFIGYDAVRRRRDWTIEDIALFRVLRDILSGAFARQRAERLMRESEERLRLSQNYANIGTWDWNIRTGELFWSERIAPLFGYPVGELETSYDNFLAAVHPEDRERLTAAVTACIEQGAEYNIEHRCTWPDGTVRWLMERGDVVRDASGQPHHMLGVVQDITNLKQAEQAHAIARDEAERANLAKSEFLSSMSHELRTPLNAILGFGQLLDMDQALSGEQRDSVVEILGAGRHLLELINEVLDLSRIESGRIELSLEAVSCATLIDECIILLNPMARQQGVRLVADVTEERVVRADRTRLKQVLLNLLSNAIKYNRPQGTATLRVVRRPGRVLLEVTDTGPGIPDERRAELFQPFSRLGAEHSEIEGTGIGLTISRRLVEMMGGAISFDSEPGVGSTFRVELNEESTT